MDIKYTYNEIGIPIYKVEPGLRLSIATRDHPDLLPYLRCLDPPSINNTNREALLKYNYYIAKDLYGLEIEFEQDNAIIPTPVMRYSFLKHILKPHATIIELGTGASAIIAMLAAKHFDAKVYATEIDLQYIQIAKENIKRNHLEEQISIIDSKGKYLDGVIPSDMKVDYIISNPPYYEKIRSPKFLWGGKETELVSGEFGEAFVIRMLVEGWKYLNTPGMISFIIPKTRPETLCAVENFLTHFKLENDVFGLKAGNRTRYVFRVYKKKYSEQELFSEME
jgi:methylase of polypeptide subunit release factors